MSGSWVPALPSSRRWRSVWHTPAARTWTRTSSGPGCGFGTWTSFTAPVGSNRIARTCGPSETGRKTVCLPTKSQSRRACFLGFSVAPNLHVPTQLAEARGVSLEGSSGIWNRIRQKPFALWVIFGGFFYLGLVILGLALPMLAASPASIADPFVVIFLVFMALFFVSAYLVLKVKRWTSVVTAVVSILFLVLLGSFLGPSLANPADASFSLAISWIPALILVAIFSILSVVHAKSGLLQKRYLATPNSSGGLLTIGVIGFVVGGLIVGAIGSGVVHGNISAARADITIVPGAQSAGMAFP